MVCRVDGAGVPADAAPVPKGVPCSELDAAAHGVVAVSTACGDSIVAKGPKWLSEHPSVWVGGLVGGQRQSRIWWVVVVGGRG